MKSTMKNWWAFSRIVGFADKVPPSPVGSSSPYVLLSIQFFARPECGKSSVRHYLSGTSIFIRPLLTLPLLLFRDRDIVLRTNEVICSTNPTFPPNEALLSCGNARLLRRLGIPFSDWRYYMNGKEFHELNYKLL